jgi:DNA polymerase alpha-associated DNA helicase A
VSPLFPPHSFRPGDLTQIVEHTASSANPSKASKLSKSVEGVVYKVSEKRIVIAVGGGDSLGSESSTDKGKGKDRQEELDLPERVRL